MSRRPIAVIGMACRFPGGASSPDEFWKIITSGTDAITEIPRDRWDVDAYFHPDTKAQGQIYTRWGGFLPDYKQFDADFFGISPREAAQVDPQQRLLLELTWEALEAAGIPAESLAGSDTAVYVGISGHEYGSAAFNDPDTLSPYSATGNSLSIAANRISYVFDLRGPSQAIDTACSSALVALHDSCAALGRGESRIAIAGGVNALMSPHSTVAFCRASMLSPTGRCRAFSAQADGYVRSEGGGVVVLKLLEHALADGDTIQAVILGAGVNQDGRTAGMAMPSAAAQEALLRRVYASAGIDPADVTYVEAHGTGTPVGDPIECTAIGNALGKVPGRTRPCLIGSVKTNVGHLESASGMAGLMKAILALRHREIPPSLHSAELNPNIPFGDLNLSVVQQATPLADERTPSIIGVNSFGFGGTNAHIVVGAHREPAADRAPARQPAIAGDSLLLLSARSPAALSAVARRYAEYLRAADAPPLDLVAGTAARRRSHHAHRLAIVGRSAPEMADRLLKFAEGEAGVLAAAGRTAKPSSRVAFVFSGNGSQWPGMGQDLLAQDREFARAVDAIDDVFGPMAGWSLRAEMAREGAAARLDQTEYAQPVLFAYQVGLCRSLAARGLVPDIVAGHSVGEVAAAHVAGRLSLEAAVRVILVRSRAQQRTHGNGAMAAVGLPFERARDEVAAFAGSLSVAAVNSGNSVTVSGDEAALARLGEKLNGEGVFFRALPLAYAFHSCHMDPIEAEVRRDLAGLAMSTASIPLISTVTGALASDTMLDGEYWWRNIRQPVQFRAAIDRILADDAEVLVEIGPHPVLEGYLRECLRGADRNGAAVATGRRAEPELPALLLALGKAYTAGARLDFARLFPGPAQHIALPPYPWQRELFDTPAKDPTLIRHVHPLLGERLKAGEPVWENRLWADKPAWIRDHVVAGAALLPGAAFVEMLAAAARNAFGAGPIEIENLELRRALTFGEGLQKVEVHLSSEDGVAEIRSGEPGAQAIHARGRVALAPERAAAAAADLEALKGRLGERAETAALYERFAAFGLSYGPAFRPIAEIWPGKGEALARLEPPAEIAGDLGRYILHPSLLDGGLQTALGAIPSSAGGTSPFVPSHFGRLRLEPSAGSARWCHARIRSTAPGSLLVDYTLLDEHGAAVAQVNDVRLVRLERASHEIRAYRWRAAPQPIGDGALRSPLAARSAGELAGIALNGPPLPLYHHVTDRLQDVCSAYAAHAFARLGLDGRSLDPARAGEEAGVVPEQRKHFDALWALLVRERLLTEDSEGWRLAIPAALADAAAVWRRACLDFPAFSAVFLVLGRTGELTADILRGKADALQVLFPGGDTTLLETLYGTSPHIEHSNEHARRIVQAIVDAWPQDRPLRILEVGAGTGGLTRLLLPQLPADRTEYHFTDVTDALLARSEARFSAYRFVRYSLFDLEKPPAEQGLEPGSFDVVIGAHVVHATSGIAKSLQHLHEALRPGGMLLLAESHPNDLLTIVFGGLKGWQSFTDRRSTPTSPLLSEADWQAAMEGAGFRDTRLIGNSSATKAASLSIILGQRGAPEPVAAAMPQFDPQRRWMIFANLDGGSKRQAALARAVEAAAARAGGASTIVTAAATGAGATSTPAIDPANPADYAALMGAAKRAGAAPTDIVHLWSVPDRSPDDTPISLDGQDSKSVSAILMSPSLSGEAGLPRPRIWFVTAGALPLRAGDLVDPSQAPLWGAARSLMTERADLDVRLVDLGLEDDDAARADALLRELSAPGDESEVLLRGSSRFVMRLTPAASSAEVAVPGVASAPFHLESRRKGTLEGLALRKAEIPQPKPGEIVAETRAAAVNFRDVLMKLGVLPDEAFERGFAGPNMGMEFAGRIVGVGEGVRNYKIGDDVFGFARGAFSSHVAAPAQAVLPKPASFGFADAATLPTVAVTVIYGLGYLARLARGERVLIHGAAGGVGLAAIQYAQHVGAEIIATAGTPEKRAILERLGVRHVFDSRTLAFADDVLAVTNGEGVDVVLNSLAGAAIQKGLGLLKPYGRFVELGKRDFFADSRIGLRPFRRNVSFFGVDVDQILVDRPDLAARLFEEFHGLIDAGVFRPLPHRTYPLADASEAFRLMQQSRHVGKIVLDIAGGHRRVEPPAPAPLSLRPDATYATAGGLGGFGLETARWLVDRGARSIVLVGRSGSARTEAAAAVEALRARGADIRVMSADITDLAQVERMMRIIDEEMPPLRGVIHAAMVIDDAIATGLTRERIRNVLAPKMVGAWNLHLATKDRPLDFFVVYSSAAAVIGNEGQSAYGAANLFLDGLAHYRRARGLPAISVAWGAIGDVGYLADRAIVRKALAERFGVNAMPAAKALERLDRAIQDGDPYIILAEMNWSRLFRADHIAALRRFTDLKAEVELGGPEDAEGGLEDLRALIANLPRAEAVAIVQQSLVRQIAQVLRIPPGKLDAERSLLELGMDSLMVVEMQMAVEKNLGVGLSTAELIDKPTIAALAARLTDRLLGADAPAAGAPPAGAPAAPANGAATVPANAGANGKENGLESLDAMSDENVYELVARLADAAPEPPKQPVKTA